MASEYKKRGGSYTTDKETSQDSSQKHLSNWTEEEWQTKEGDANATKPDGTKKRYLPKKAWEGMSEEEKEETEAKKEEGGIEGKQYVGNTGKAREERRKISKDGGKDESVGEDGDDESRNKKKGSTSTASKKGGKSGRSSKTNKVDEKEKGEEDSEDKDGDFIEDAEANQEEEEEAEDVGDSNEKDKPHGQKRVHTRQDDKAENKKPKTSFKNEKEDGEKD